MPTKMNLYKYRFLLISIFILFYSTIFAEMNGRGQIFEILNEIEDKATTQEKIIVPIEDMWQRINSGYQLKAKKTKRITKRINKYEKWYVQRPEYMERMLKRSEKYLYYISNEVQKRGMPMEIALLPMIESAYNPIAKSNKKAVGLWQFISSTGKLYGLKQNWWRDDRKSVIQSTDAALNYLEKLHAQFNSWELALAAYNAGEGRVGRAIKRNKKRKKATDYYSLRLPRETRNYVPKLLAMRNILQNPSEYGIHVPKLPDQPYFSTVKIPDEIDTELIPQFAEISMEEFQFLNAEHKRPLLKARNLSQYVLIPANAVERFNINLYSYNKPLISWKTYKPKRGERIKRVAKKFGVNEKLLRKINRLRSRKTFRRNSIVLIPHENASSTNFALNDKVGLFNYSTIITHKISSGDTLGHLSRKYKISIRDLMEFNELKSHKIILGAILDIPK